jgi:hypothetical protein
MKKGIFILVGLLIFYGLSAQEIPQSISYQGKLLENGAQFSGTKSITFSIGSWSDTQNVSVSEGLYSVTLGSTSNPIPISVFNNSSSVSLEVTIAGTTLTPQTEILSVPFAFKAEKSVDTEKIAGNPVSNVAPSSNNVLKWNGSTWIPQLDETGSSFWINNGTQLYPLNTSWRVGIGTISPDPSITFTSYTTTNGNAAIGGYSYGTSGAGVFGYSENGYAGVQGVSSGSNYGVYFSGGLGGSGSKSCVIKTSKGPTEMYCVESPEMWFEDFGSGKLIGGYVKIELDSYFLESVTIDKDFSMKVFIQLKDNCNGVFVNTNNTYFEVYELSNGNSNAEFDYRIVAKRKGFETQRMKVVENCYLDRYLYPDDNDSFIPQLWKEKRKEINR